MISLKKLLIIVLVIAISRLPDTQCAVLSPSISTLACNATTGATCEMPTTGVPTFTVTPSGKMPVVGYGTWQAKDEELEKALEAALNAGYRHIDTAYVYENEKVIGRVLKKWFTSGKISRKDIYLVTKLPSSGNRPEGVQKYLKRSLENLQLDYVDMYLIHTPFGVKDVEGDLRFRITHGKIDVDKTTDHVAVWKEMEKQVDAGLTKAIGLSNFNMTQITKVLNDSRIKPSNLQVELHPYLQQKKLVDFCKKHNIVVTACSPLGSPGLAKSAAQVGNKINHPDILGNPVIKEIAKKHGKTTAQIILRFTIQRGIAVIPKSTNVARLRQNLELFDFTLDEDDMIKIDKLDENIRILDFGLFDGVKEHPEYPFPK